MASACVRVKIDGKYVHRRKEDTREACQLDWRVEEGGCGGDGEDGGTAGGQQSTGRLHLQRLTARPLNQKNSKRIHECNTLIPQTVQVLKTMHIGKVCVVDVHVVQGKVSCKATGEA